jgi:hypothetical protein
MFIDRLVSYVVVRRTEKLGATKRRWSADDKIGTDLESGYLNYMRNKKKEGIERCHPARKLLLGRADEEGKELYITGTPRETTEWRNGSPLLEVFKETGELGSPRCLGSFPQNGATTPTLTPDDGWISHESS